MSCGAFISFIFKIFTVAYITKMQFLCESLITQPRDEITTPTIPVVTFTEALSYQNETNNNIGK